MNGSVAPLLWILLGFLIGALISWILASSRQRAAVAQASAVLQMELSTVRERASRLPELERELNAAMQTLNRANERKAALESEILRMPELENRRAQTAEALEAAARTAADLRELSGRQAAELSAERENLASFRSRFEEIQTRFESKSAEAGALAVEVAQLRNSLDGERSVSQ